MVREFPQTLAGVRDEITAEEAIADLRLYAAPPLGRGQVFEIEVASSDENRFQDELQEIQQAAFNQGLEIGKQIAAEAERIAGLTNLSLPTKFALGQATDDALLNLQRRDMMESAFRRVYPAAETVQIVLSGDLEADSRSLLPEYVQQQCNVATINLRREKERTVLLAAPVSDPGAFAASLDRGEVGQVQGRTMEWKISDADLADIVAQKKAMKAAAEQERREEKARLEAEETARQVREVNDGLDQITSHLSRMQSVESSREAVDDLAKAVRRFQMDIDEKHPGAETVVPGGPLGERDQFKTIRSEVERISAKPQLRVMLSEKFGAATVDAILGFDVFREYGRPSQNPSHPDYLIANANIVKTGDHFEREKALKRLAGAGTDVDASSRKYVARAIRDAILADPEEEMVPALAHWAGKHSVPILIELLHSDDSTFFQDTILKQLAKFPSAKVAESITPFVGEFRTHDDACRALVEIGSVAEPAVIKIVPANDPEICLAAIQILATIGTEQSKSILQQAGRKGTPEVRQAAKQALAEILARSKKTADEQFGMPVPR